MKIRLFLFLNLCLLTIHSLTMEQSKNRESINVTIINQNTGTKH